MKRAVVTLSLCALLWVAYLALAHQLASHDVIAALLRGDIGTVVSIVLVVGLRLFLILAAPAWLLWLLLGALERRFAASNR